MKRPRRYIHVGQKRLPRCQFAMKATVCVLVSRRHTGEGPEVYLSKFAMTGVGTKFTFKSYLQIIYYYLQIIRQH